MTDRASNPYFAKGLEHAAYQTRGMSVSDGSVIKAWRREAMAAQKGARSTAKKDYLAGFVRGLTDALHGLTNY